MSAIPGRRAVWLHMTCPVHTLEKDPAFTEHLVAALLAEFSGRVDRVTVRYRDYSSCEVAGASTFDEAEEIRELAINVGRRLRGLPEYEKVPRRDDFKARSGGHVLRQ